MAPALFLYFGASPCVFDSGFFFTRSARRQNGGSLSLWDSALLTPRPSTLGSRGTHECRISFRVGRSNRRERRSRGCVHVRATVIFRRRGEQDGVDVGTFRPDRVRRGVRYSRASQRDPDHRCLGVLLRFRTRSRGEESDARQVHEESVRFRIAKRVLGALHHSSIAMDVCFSDNIHCDSDSVQWRIQMAGGRTKSQRGGRDVHANDESALSASSWDVRKIKFEDKEIRVL